MNDEEKKASSEPGDTPSKGAGSKQEVAASPEPAGPGETSPSLPLAETPDPPTEKPQAASISSAPSIDREPQPDGTTSGRDQKLAILQTTGAKGESIPVLNPHERLENTSAPQQATADGSPSSSVEPAMPRDEAVSSIAAKAIFAGKRHGLFEEQPLPVVEMAPHLMRHRTRREVLAFGISMTAMAAGAGYLLPQNTLNRLGVRRDLGSRAKEWLLNNALRVDDDVAEALYSHNRLAPTYTKSQITPIKNNYNGATPDPWYISNWNLTLDGLSSGLSIRLDIRTLMNRFSVHDQITRFVCVEGWSAIAWWAGLRFDDLLRAYPPKSQAKWARVESSVNLDNSGNPDPYFVSIDLTTARHPQTLRATHHDGLPLTVEHGAPLRLLAPVKLGLKNVKAVTRITYSAEEPKDYWAPYGYSSYDGI